MSNKTLKSRCIRSHEKAINKRITAGIAGAGHWDSGWYGVDGQYSSNLDSPASADLTAGARGVYKLRKTKKNIETKRLGAREKEKRQIRRAAFRQRFANRKDSLPEGFP